MHDVVFRADASPAIGSGHLMRCLSLANVMAAEGWACIFAGIPETVSIFSDLPSQFRWIELQGSHNEQIETLAYALPEKAAWLIADNYELDSKFESEALRISDRVMVIDDLANRPHNCNILLDQTFGRKAEDYCSLVGEGTRLLIGSDYALLREEFARVRRNIGSGPYKANNPPRVLVSMGGTDPWNGTETALLGIGETGLDMGVLVLIGSGAPYLAEVKRAGEKIPQKVAIRIDAPDIAAAMAECDIAIGAAGSMSWERCCLGLPSLLAIMTDNQKLIAENLAACGAALNIGDASCFTPAHISSALIYLLKDSAGLNTMRQAAYRVCDGGGALRTFKEIM